MSESAPYSPLDSDLNLLFGVLALQLELIDVRQFAEACASWAAAKAIPLAEWLVTRGWITPADRAEVEHLLHRKLKKHGGQVRAGLQAAIDPVARQALGEVNDPVVRSSLDDLPPPPGGMEAPSTEVYVAPSRYRLTRVHKEGGLGRVWLARDGDLNRDVALKVIKPGKAGSPELRRRFLQEAQITGQLEHPNIVPVYELGHAPDNGEPFYAMKLVRGRTLAAAVAEHHRARGGGPPDPGGRRRLLGDFVGVCNAVAYAHARGVLHRDLKPANVVLGKFGEVLLLDWGLAKVLGGAAPEEDVAPVVLSAQAQADATSLGALLGTPAYMAPEQADRRLDLVDKSTDVYGLGTILFEILTGRPPHTGSDTDAICRQIIDGDSPRARLVESTVPAALDAICSRAMAKAQAERYSSAAALAEAVQGWLADEPLEAYRGIVTDLEKLARQHPDVPDYREQLARNRVNLGLVLGGMGRHAEAERVLQESIAEYEALAQAAPAEPRYRADLAAARFHVSRALLALNRSAEAREAQRAAAADYGQLAAANPRAQEYHGNLASVLLTLAPGALQVPPRPPEELPTGIELPASTVPPTPAPAERPADMHARLTLLQQFAVGGMSQIWVARDHDLNREVAIKEIRAGGGDDAAVRRRFLREAQITAQLEHPHIVPVYGLGRRSGDDAPFLIMRLVRGPTLQQAIREYHSRQEEADGGPRRLLTAFVAACSALAHAHRRGVIHRDPKSANILLGEGDEVLVADWGLAKLLGKEEEDRPALDVSDWLLEEEEGDRPALEVSDWAEVGTTQTGAVLGTPAYMSPEQAQGCANQVDARSDIYVLGAVLFEILTGRPPGQGATALETIHRLVTEGPPRARAVKPTVPRELDAVCARAMARVPADRYASAADLGRDVERWLAGEPVSVYPESWLRRLGRRFRRRPAVGP
jgi:serine/threonine protein kinase